MVQIPEYKRDESKDYKFVLEGLNRIPFPVGKNLLVDFLKGNEDNRSILKNNLGELENFSSLSYLEEEKIRKIVDKLVANQFIETSSSVFNNGSTVLSISEKGKSRIFEFENQSGTILKEDLNKEEIKSLFEFKDFLSGFNNEQKKAIISQKKEILCVAGAGSGKTTVLTKRIEFLTKLGRVHGDKILAVTFTRKAKEEMEKRLLKSGVRVVVETFNSFSEKVLLKNAGRIYGRRTRIASFHDKMIAVLRALDETGFTIEEAVLNYFESPEKLNKNIYELQNMFISDCFNVFEYFKVLGISIEEFKKKYFLDDDKTSNMIFEIIKFLESHFSSNGLRTYADQVKDAVTFFKMYPKFIPEFEHVLVDEFQDVNSEQISLIELLNPKNLFCVGDPRQSIFGWRGSEIRHIMDFKKNRPQSEIVYLNKNYRSRKKIIEFMNESIKKMNLPGLEPDSHGEEDYELEILKFENEGKEFDFVKEKILSSEIAREEIFVLARTNRKLQDFSNVLKKSGIKHIIKNENSREISAKKGEVTLSTVHSAKGLEAEAVFLIGCTNGNFPTKYSEHPIIEKIKIYDYNKEEEERRLFYVALSRARKNLYLTYSGKSHTYFISEGMKEIIEK
ncbi:MAG: exodeoxyribonuclease V subunit gamma [Nanoarchaeota archaeon]|nr:exodeoxyribonuclease V subunit gamma [Nanoarchaeota archaeon]